MIRFVPAINGGGGGIQHTRPCAVATADAALAQCPTSNREMRQAARATATTAVEAFAEAIARANVFCESTASASVCGWGSSGITAFAEAQGQAMAQAFASVDTACGCTFDVEALAIAVTEVFASATSDVFAEVCGSGAPPICVPVCVPICVRRRDVRCLCQGLRLRCASRLSHNEGM